MRIQYILAVSFLFIFLAGCTPFLYQQQDPLRSSQNDPQLSTNSTEEELSRLRVAVDNLTEQLTSSKIELASQQNTSQNCRDSRDLIVDQHRFELKQQHDGLSSAYQRLFMLASEPAYTGWELINADEFLFLAPPGLEYHQQQGIDSYVGAYKNSDFTIVFDYGPYGGDFSEMGGGQGYEMSNMTIDGYPATIVTYDPHKDYSSSGTRADIIRSFSTSVILHTTKGDTILAVSMVYYSAIQKANARKIVESLTFTETH